MPRPITFLYLLVFCLLPLRQSAAQSYWPPQGIEGLKAEALELRNHFTVLMISLKPGEEDLSTLAAYRLWKGATVTSLYVTNGEAGESDIEDEYPHFLAARRREEAASAMSMLGCGSYFLNMPDQGAVRDTSSVYVNWDRDTLETRLMRVLSSFRPDLVILSSRGEGEYYWAVIKDILLTAIERLRPARSLEDLTRMAGMSPWEVVRVYDAGREGISYGNLGLHPAWKKSVTAIAGDAAKAYRSQRSRVDVQPLKYAQLYPAQRLKRRTMDQGLPQATRSLRRLEGWIKEVADEVIRNAARINRRQNPRSALIARSTVILDSLDRAIREEYVRLTAADRRILVHWKEKLQKLRNTLLGVRVDARLSESTLTGRQLTFLAIDTLTGIAPAGKTYLYFPFARDGWIVNEVLKQERVEYQSGKEYELITPENISMHLPAAFEGLGQHTLSWPMGLFVVHEAGTRNKSFIEKIILPMKFAPKFTAEVLTPIVRAGVPNDVVVRLTNNSRDGVADYVTVSDSLVSSPRAPFRLSTKGEVSVDTLLLTWATLQAGEDYVIPVMIDNFRVGQFGARSFEMAVDTTLRVGLVTAFARSAVEQTLRQSAVRVTRVPLERNRVYDDFDVLVLDRRVLSLDSLAGLNRDLIPELAASGKRVLILPQDVETWNSAPLVAGVRVRSSDRYEAADSLVFDQQHSLFNSPNLLGDDDWSDWLYYRSGQRLILDSEGLEVPLRVAADGNPLIVSRQVGNGRITYVNLALSWQWLNIHPGSFRFLANLLSY